MVKLVYTYALGAYAARRAGSSPVAGTITPFGVYFLAKYDIIVVHDKNPPFIGGFSLLVGYFLLTNTAVPAVVRPPSNTARGIKSSGPVDGILLVAVAGVVAV